MPSAIIHDLTYYLPENVLTNAELALLYPEWSSEKIQAKLGIAQRHVASAHECASDLAFNATQALLDRSTMDRADIDFLLFCTQSPDYFLPTSACILQHRLGLSNRCAALDFNLGCSGFVYGIGLAKSLIESGQARNVLLLAADTYSKFINPGDKSVRTLFGDAGSATLISADNTKVGDGILAVQYGTDGSGAGSLMVPTGGLRKPRVVDAPVTEDASGNKRTENDLVMDGAQIFAFTLREVPALLEALLEMESLTKDDVDLYVFHQANVFMLEHLRRKLGIAQERFVVDMADCGNTVSCSIPIALARAERTGRLRPGMLVALVGFGVGLSWAGALLRWK